MTKSHALGKELESLVGTGNNNIPVVNGIDIEKFKATPSLVDELKQNILFGKKFDLVIGTVGRLSHQKGQEFLLRAMPEIIKVCPNSLLLVVGVGELENYLKNLASELGIGKYVIFVGYSNSIPELLSLMDLFVLPSRWEGFPNSIIEAMAMNVPVIATGVDGVTEALEDGVNGVFIEKEDFASIVQCVKSYLDDRKTFIRRSQQAYTCVVQKYKIQNVVCQYEEIFKRFI